MLSDSEGSESSYELLKKDPEEVEFAWLSILEIGVWAGEREIHVKLLGMLLEEAEDVLARIDAAAAAEGVEEIERSVHYFKGSADVVRADRLTLACMRVLKFLREDRLAEAIGVLGEVRGRFEELNFELEKTGYLGG